MKIVLFVFSLICISSVYSQTTNQTNQSGDNIGRDKVINNTYIIGDTSHHSANKNANSNLPQGKPANSPCAQQNSGDICFESKIPSYVTLNMAQSKNNVWDGNSIHITFQPNELKCSYSLPAGTYTYDGWYQVLVYDVQGSMHKQLRVQGQILVEQCKSKTVVLR